MRTGLAAGAASALMLALAACGSSDPAEQQADAIEARADNQADGIEDAAEAEADRMEDQAEALRNQAAATGGFEADRLNTRAAALEREAEIVEDQGDTRAEAIKDAADGQAGQIRAGRQQQPAGNAR